MSTSLNPVQFGPYRLSSRIATGGMAEVYAARRIDASGQAGPLVALKRLLPHLAKDPNIVRMFLNEARITAQIHHPNVVRVLDLGHHDGEPFIAMELLVGHSFAEIRQKAAERGERVPLGITLKVLCDACRGLNAAHTAQDEQGRSLWIVHRDFTPDNIHVGFGGQVKVIDFGIAKAENLSAGTEPGTLKGKFFYMSPEMIAGRPVDHRADLYAAGVMLYEQLCGRRPFTGTTPDEVLDRIAEARPRRPTEFDPSVPPALEAVCLQALRQDPNDRFPTLDHFIQAIESIGGVAEVASAEALGSYVRRLFPVDGDHVVAAIEQARQVDPSTPRAAGTSEIPASARTPQPRPAVRATRGKPPRSRRGLWIAVAVGLVLALGGAAGAWWLNRPTPPPVERIALATQIPDRIARAAALSGIGEDPRASEKDLVRAGELLVEVKAADAALALAEAGLRRFPKSRDLHLIEAEAWIALRQGRRAEAAIDKARNADPKSPEPALVLARLRELQGDLPGATAALAEALKKEPDSLKVAARQGYLLSQSGRLDEAEAVLGKVLRRRFDAESAAELAFVRYRQDRVGDASALLRRAIRAQPKLARAHYYLGAVLYRQGDKAGAERAYLEAEKLAQDDSRPLLALCELYKQTGRAAELPTLQRRIEAQFPEEADTLKRRCGM